MSEFGSDSQPPVDTVIDGSVEEGDCITATVDGNHLVIEWRHRYEPDRWVSEYDSTVDLGIDAARKLKVILDRFLASQAVPTDNAEVGGRP